MQPGTAVAPPLLLLVEDDPDDVELARLALERSNVPHRLEVARDGREALDFLGCRGRWTRRDPADLPALVLLDLKLPLISGKDVLRQIRLAPTLSAMPVVILSSSDEVADVASCYQLGANSYFRKPIDFGDFTHGVSVLLYYWMAVNASPWHRRGSLTGNSFPRLHHPEHVLRLIPGEAGLPDQSRAPVVVIDSEAAARARTIEALATLGHHPIGGGASVDEAIRFLLDEGVCRGHDPWRCPTLVLVELTSGGDRGLDLIRAIRAEIDHRLGVVVFTERDDPALVETCYRANASSYIVKPNAPDDYRDIVRLIGYYWLNLNIRPPTRTIPPSVKA